MIPLVPPATRFGNKATAAPIVWKLLGDVEMYIEPFAGLAAVLLARPKIGKNEVINDADGHVVNFWRATQAAPERVAEHSLCVASSTDLKARKAYLDSASPLLKDELLKDPLYYDAELAGWWCWCNCTAIAGGNTLHLGSQSGVLKHHQGSEEAALKGMLAEFQLLRNRLLHVKIDCGNWEKVCNHDFNRTIGSSGKPVGYFLDPPYKAQTTKSKKFYDVNDTPQEAIVEWALPLGDDYSARIILCGYQDEFPTLAGHGWKTVSWTGRGTWGSGGKKNVTKIETLWASPHCQQAGFFT